MSERNSKIKDYNHETFVEEDEVLLSIKKSIIDEDLPNIAIPVNVGKLIYILAKIHKPKRILEIGTLAGYSAIWLAKAVPTAEIVTIEGSAKHAAIARCNFKKSPFANRIQLLEGNARKILESLISENSKFDLIFLDANKQDYPVYLELITQLAQSGALLLTDNLIPKTFPNHEQLSKDAGAEAVYCYNAALADHPNFESAVIPCIEENGEIDGFGISICKGHNGH